MECSESNIDVDAHIDIARGPVLITPTGNDVEGLLGMRYSPIIVRCVFIKYQVVLVAQ